MPTYEYRCENCLQKVEIFQKITEEAIKKCPHCGESALVRGPGGGIGLSFSGSGWYKTDYASSPPKEGGCCPCGKNPTSCPSPEK